MTRPASGAGSVAGFGARLLAFVVDSVVSIGIALISGRRPGTPDYGLVVYGAFLLIELVFLPLAAQTPGMRVARIAVVSVRDGSRPRLHWALLRTVLLAAVAPALIVTDSSGRPLHDRATGLVMLRTR